MFMSYISDWRKVLGKIPYFEKIAKQVGKGVSSFVKGKIGGKLWDFFCCQVPQLFKDFARWVLSIDPVCCFLATCYNFNYLYF